jgi:hypothetical protein
MYAAKSLGELKRQRDRQFETIFVERYWALMDRLSLAAIKGRPQSTVDPNDEKVALQYFRLSEDELELHRGGWISEQTWTVWHEGIQAQMKRWPFCAVWEEARDTSEFAMLKKLAPGRAEVSPREEDDAAADWVGATGRPSRGATKSIASGERRPSADEAQRP